MSRLTATIGLAAVGLFALIGLSLGQSDARKDLPDRPREQAVASDPQPGGQMPGVASCSGQGCHGGAIPPEPLLSAWLPEKPESRWKSSDTIWRAYDPHAQAYAILLKPASLQIAQRLWGENAKAHERSECLACHSNPAFAERTDPAGRAIQVQGVGCEACHGNASGWIDSHTGWIPGPEHREKLAVHGMRNLANVSVRAEMCAGCHVGSSGSPLRDMNHDMIAAGHPRLNFDYATFLRALPPHWVEKDRDVSPAKPRAVDDQFRHWAVGRAAVNAAGLNLLADRASRSWPEFADFDCYACHHNLSPKRQPILGIRPGALTWNEPPLSAALADLANDRALIDSSDAVRKSFTRLGKSGDISNKAKDAATKWNALAETWSSTPPSLTAVANRLSDVNPRRWDDACHLYYSLLAIDRSRSRTLSVDEQQSLEKIRSSLALPRGLEGSRFNSPIDFEPRAMPFGDLFKARSSK